MRSVRGRFVSQCLGAALCLCLSAAVGVAQPVPGREMASAETMEFVREMMARNLPAHFVDLVAKKLARALEQQGHCPPDLADRVASGILEPALTDDYPELEAITARIWTDRFNQAEMDALLASFKNRDSESQTEFVTTPLGQKFLSLKHVIGVASGDAAEAWATRTLQLAIRQHAEALRRLGIDPDTGEYAPPKQM